MDRKPIGYVVATVRFPVYEGDTPLESGKDEWDGFEYHESSINGRGKLAVCVRKCETLSADVRLESKVSSPKLKFPHPGGCVECWKKGHCSYCGGPLGADACTNGRCAQCHSKICGPGVAHGYGKA